MQYWRLNKNKDKDPIDLADDGMTGIEAEKSQCSDGSYGCPCQDLGPSKIC
jgi:hypothetical protein